MAKIKLFLIVILVLSLLSQKSFGQYWSGTNKVSKAEMAMLDCSFPYMAETTYWAFLHTWVMDGNGKTRIFFYGGVAHNDHKNPKYFHKTLSQMAVWGHGNPVKPVYVKPGFLMTKDVGEGASARAAGYEKIQVNRWYRHLVKVWSPKKRNGKSYLGWWCKDLKGKLGWELLAVFELGFEGAKIQGSGLGGFLEDFGNGGRKPRAQSFRNMYSFADGKWYPSGLKSDGGKGYFRRMSTDEKESVGSIAVSNQEVPDFKKTTGEIEQLKLVSEKEPVVEELKIGRLKAVQFNRSIAVSWNLTKDSSPQLRTLIEVFDQKNGGGKKVGRFWADAPQTRKKLLQIDSPAKSLKLTVFDVFGSRKSQTVELRPCPDQSISFARPSNENGVIVTYWVLPKAKSKLDRSKKEFFANWNRLPKTKGLVKQRVVQTRSLNLHAAPRRFGIVANLKTILKIEREGIYRFYFTACDGGRLRLGNQISIAQRTYQSVQPETVFVKLKKGYYPVSAQVYFDSLVNRGTAANLPTLQLEYEGPEIGRQPIPAAAMFLPKKFGTKKGAVRVVWLKTQDGRTRVQVKSVNRIKWEKVQIVDQKGAIWGSIENNDSLSEVDLRLPEGNYQFTPRVFLNQKDVVELKEVSHTSRNPEPEFWKISTAKDSVRPLGFDLKRKNVWLMGDGRNWAYRKVEGDFDFSMRVKANRNVVGKTGNDSRVSIGLIASSTKEAKPEQSLRWYYNRYFKSRYERPDRPHHGLKQKPWIDSAHAFNVSGGYVRMIRKGTIFSLMVKDWKSDPWRSVLKQKLPLEKRVMYVGPYLSQSPIHDPGAFYSVEFDEINLIQND